MKNTQTQYECNCGNTSQTYTLLNIVNGCKTLISMAFFYIKILFLLNDLKTKRKKIIENITVATHLDLRQKQKQDFIA